MVILSALKVIFLLLPPLRRLKAERKRYGANAITASSKIFVEWPKGIFRKDAAVKNLYIKLNQTKRAVFAFLEPFAYVLNKQLRPLTGRMARSFIINDQKNAYRRYSFRRNESRNRRWDPFG